MGDAMCYHSGRLQENGRVSVEMGTPFAAQRGATGAWRG